MELVDYGRDSVIVQGTKEVMLVQKQYNMGCATICLWMPTPI